MRHHLDRRPTRFGDAGQRATLGVEKDDPVVFVVDVVVGRRRCSTRPHGKAVAPKTGLPTVTMNEGKPATITVPKGVKAPTKTVVQPLIEGTGAEVEEGPDRRAWPTPARSGKDGSVFDSSASRPEQPLLRLPDRRRARSSRAGTTALVGQKVGSRVLLVIPPAEGYGEAGSPPKITGTDTLVFVVDILAAY